MDLYSRMALSHSLSNTFYVDFCTECLKEAIANFGVPEMPLQTGGAIKSYTQ
jgi:hypothetical protein